MCSKPNQPHAEECEFCGARLKPLDIGSSEQAGGEEVDWLNRIRDQAVPPEDDEIQEPEEQASDEDWLGRLREASSEEPEASSFEPEAETPEVEIPPAELPVADTPEPDAEVPGVEAPETGTPDLDATESEELAEGDAPEWLSRIRKREEQLGFGEGQPPEEETEWLDKLRAATPEEPGFEQPIDIPKPDPDDASDVEDLSWLEDLQVDAPGPQAEAEPEPEPEPKELEPEEPQPDEPPAPEPPAEEPAPELPAEDGELPHVPALIVEEGAQAPGLAAVDLPEWLGEADDSQELSAEGEEKPERDLAPATLPAWLEAMRPVETFQSVVEIEPEEDQAVESVGPLAGLRGVLMAEPAVAMPRTSQGGSMQLGVSERQFAQAELLQRMVREEQREEPTKASRGPRLAFIRWGITAVLFLAAAMPSILGFPTFRLPILEPRELGALFELVNGLPTDEPALFVFDYEPGYSGEMDAVSGPLIEQVASRGIPLVTMSTKPTGSPMAVRLVDRFGQKYGYENGVNLIHLGFLSGGPTAVQLFAIAPREAILRGFSLPVGLSQTTDSAWESAVLSEVNDLKDFGMIAVISSGTENARTWVEQARLRMGDTPLVMVLSAGAEPLVRPYFEAERPQVNGILSGLPAAAAYERRIAQSGDAQGRWDSFGAGMFAAEIVLIFGVAFGAGSWYLRRRE
jgi:hypothetical protein